jgi:hypothetical protein
MRNLSLVFLLLFSSIAFSFPLAPDTNQTTGDLCTRSNPDFKEYRYGEQIPYCERNVSSGLKARIYADYGVPAKCKSRYTIDHFIPLALGGSNEYENLWPEHKLVKATRPNLETELYWQIRNGRITQQQAIDIITEAKLNPPAIEAGEDSAPCDRP